MREIPLWIAAPITIVISLPFGLWFGAWSLPLWLVFIVWAEYFALGAKPAALRTIIPAFTCGVLGATFMLVVSLIIRSFLGNASIVTAGDLSWFIGLFVSIMPVVYVMKFLPFTQGPGGLPFFNGMSMGLGTFFVGTYTAFGGLSLPADSLLLPLITSIPAVLGGLLGAALGWFNAAIMTPFRTTSADSPEESPAI